MSERGEGTFRGGRDVRTCGIGATSWAIRQTATLHVSLDFGRREGVGVGGNLLLFQGPLLNCAVNLLQVGDAGVLLGGRASFHEVRNRDSGQQTDNRNHDHDFNEGERTILLVLDLHCICLSVFPARTLKKAVIMIIAVLSTYCLRQPGRDKLAGVIPMSIVWSQKFENYFTERD